MKSTEFLQAAIDTQAERGKQYDSPEGGRSMGRTVQAFNSITGRDLTEAEGWLLLQLLKDVRQWQNPDKYHHDSALDGVAYASLKAEALSAGHLLDAACDADPTQVEQVADMLNGWIEHDGKGCPVAAGTRVEVRYREPRSTDRNEVFETKAGALWSWPDARPNYNPDNDIVAYRLA